MLTLADRVDVVTIREQPVALWFHPAGYRINFRLDSYRLVRAGVPIPHHVIAARAGILVVLAFRADRHLVISSGQ